MVLTGMNRTAELSCNSIITIKKFKPKNTNYYMHACLVLVLTEMTLLSPVGRDYPAFVHSCIAINCISLIYMVITCALFESCMRIRFIDIHKIKFLPFH